MAASPEECSKAAKQITLCTTECRTCKRVGIPILPLRYAIIPSEKVGGRALLGKEFEAGKKIVAPDLGKNYKNKPLQRHSYSIRTLRQGFLYVYLEDINDWQGYGVNKEGYLTLFPKAHKPTSDGHKPLKPECVTKHHYLAASFLNIPQSASKSKIWIAFSQVPWSQATMLKYAENESLRKRRMTAIELATLENNPTQGDSFEIDDGLNTLAYWVEEYSANQRVAKSRSSWVVPEVDKIEKGNQLGSWAQTNIPGASWSVHGFHDRSSNISNLALYAKHWKSTYKKPLFAIVLDDVPAVIQELNHSKIRKDIENKIWMSVDDRTHKHLSSEAIKGVRNYIKLQARASVMAGASEKQGKNLKIDEQNGDLYYNDTEIPWSEFKTKQENGEIPHTARWERTRSVTGAGELGKVIDYSGERADSRFSRQFEQFEKQFNEQARDHFDKKIFRPHAENHDNTMAALDEDHAQWLDHDTGPKPQQPAGLVSICSFDFVQKSEIDVSYTQLVSDCFNGVLLMEHSLKWVEKNLQKNNDSAKQILINAAVGNHKDYLREITGADNQYSKLFDMAKSALTAKAIDHKYSKEVYEVIYETMITSIIKIFNQVSGRLADIEWPKIDQTVAFATALWKRVEHHPVRFYDYAANSFLKAMDQASDYMSATAAKLKTNRIRLPQKIRVGKAVKLDFGFWINAADGSILSPSEANARFGKAQQGVRIVYQGKKYLVSAETAELFFSTTYRKVRSTIANRDTGLAVASIYFQYRGLTNAYKALKDAAPDQRVAAMLGLVNASFSLLGGVLDMTKITMLALNAKTTLADALGRLASWAGVAAGMVDCVNGFKSARDNLQENDTDAAQAYGVGTAFSMAGVIVSMYMAATGATSLLTVGASGFFFLGPVGWAIVLGILAATAFYFASEWEDTDAAKWVARNKFWSKRLRKEPAYKSWQEEESAVKTIYHGISGQIEFQGKDLITREKIIRQPDEIVFRVKVARFSEELNAWRYRILGIPHKGQPVEIDHRFDPQISEFLNRYPIASKDPSLSIETLRSKQYQTSGGLILEGNYRCANQCFKEVRLEFEFISDLDASPVATPIMIGATYNKTSTS